MSCLKSASTIFSGLDAEPKKKVQLTIAAARHFEKYIHGNIPSDSKTQVNPYKIDEEDKLKL